MKCSLGKIGVDEMLAFVPLSQVMMMTMKKKMMMMMMMMTMMKLMWM